MILSDRNIRHQWQVGHLGIDPFNPENLGPASYDLTLGGEFRFFDEDDILNETLIDFTGPLPKMPGEHFPQGLVLEPGECALGTSVERLKIPNTLFGRVEDRSSFGRLFLLTETAGVVDPGFAGQITFEFKNLSPLPILLRPGLLIAQIVFHQMAGIPVQDYGQRKRSKYHGQEGTTESRIHMERP